MGFDDEMFSRLKGDNRDWVEAGVILEKGIFTIDDLLMKMHLEDVTSYESVARLDQGANMMERQIAHVRNLSVMDYGDAQEEHESLLRTTIGGWLTKAFFKDEDFVERAVEHIIQGTAAGFFE